MKEEQKNKKIKETNKDLAPMKEKGRNSPSKFISHIKYYHKKNKEKRVAKDFTNMLSKSIKVMLPWLIIPTILFLFGAYYIFKVVVFGYYTPLWFKIVFGIINFGFFLLVGLFYGLFMGLIASLKVFSQKFGLIMRQAMNSVKGAIENKINSLSFEMFSKKELSNLIGETFNDFNQKIKKYAKGTAFGFVAIGIMASLLFLAKNFLVRSLGAIKSKTEAFALISARTSLLVAIVLNATLFIKVFLWIGTFIGIGILLLQALFVLYLG